MDKSKSQDVNRIHIPIIEVYVDSLNKSEITLED